MSAFEIVPYTDEHAKAFYDLNVEWLSTFFYVEDVDETVLANPKEYILDQGGHILMAIMDGKAIGACALKKQSDNRYELTKLAVTPRVQGLGIGKALTIACIELFKTLDGDLLYLETNSSLKTAIGIYKKLGFVEMENPSPTIYDRADYYMEWPE